MASSSLKKPNDLKMNNAGTLLTNKLGQGYIQHPKQI
jgi:hypothetical protein